MLDKTSHPFIVNTLESDPYWALVLHQNRVHGSILWAAELEFDIDPTSSRAEGSTLSEALDRLEGVLSGRGAELAGRASE